MACLEFHTAAQKTDTPLSIVWRLAEPRDLAALFELDRVCFGCQAWSLRSWREVVQAPAWTTVVLERDDAIAAVSVLLLAAPVSNLASLAVHPSWRRRGIARFLIRDALVRARGISARWLSLEVDCGHCGAIALYRHEGFGVLRRYWEDGRSRLEMIRRLGVTRTSLI